MRALLWPFDLWRVPFNQENLDDNALGIFLGPEIVLDDFGCYLFLGPLGFEIGL